MDPFLAINKVFSLVSQEERQRTMGSQLTSNPDTTSTMAFVVNDSNRFVSGGPNKSNASMVPTGLAPIMVVLTDQVLPILVVPTGQETQIMVALIQGVVDHFVPTTIF